MSPRAVSRRPLHSPRPIESDAWNAPVPEEPRRGSSLEMIGQSAAMQRIFRLVSKVAPTESPVLITGESGTGKELIAHAIHLQSKRSNRPFVAVNSSALPETLLEGELFGYTKGAFTGATTDHPGLMQLADRGTLFLDEIAEMSPSVQAKLLRALQNGEIRRLGGREAVRVDLRVIAATNRDIKRALAEGKFREDLYYRLNVFHIELPPLRERRQDIPLLANWFREKFARENEKRVVGFDESAQMNLMHYDYPGNVRQLENIIERAVVLTEGDVITAVDLPLEVRKPGIPLLGRGAAFPYSEGLTLAQLEAEHIRRVLVHTAGNTTKAAKSLGISRSTLWRKMKEYGL